MGFSLELKIPGSVALGYIQKNHYKEFYKPRRQGLFSSKQESHQKRRIESKTQRRKGGRDAQHIQVNSADSKALRARGG